jgi:hypothetical protein
MVESQNLKAKGALLIPLALIVNSLKNADWKSHGGLTDDDLQRIRKGILASQWYERDMLERVASAVFKVAGQGKPESAYQFGFGVMAESLLKIYRGPLTESNPEELLRKFSQFWNGTWFNSGRIEFSMTSQGALARVVEPNGIICQECFVPMLRGIVMRLMKENGLKNGQVEIPEEALVEKEKLISLTMNIRYDK